MPYYTRTGDAGQTSLNPHTSKTSKASPQIEALGQVDEVQAYLGLCRTHCREHDIARALRRMQDILFRIQAQIGKDARVQTLLHSVTPEHVQEAEHMIAYFERALPGVTKFIVGGASPLGAMLNFARTLTRRAERAVVRYQEESIALDPPVLGYLNRLSTVLYVMSREA